MTQAWALEVDERLTLRILKTTGTKKTMLINRGTEDGLKKGDHAKFFLTSGVVARGVVIKVSPMRSIWAIYRLINADSLANDQVMNLKITEPVKVTFDNTKPLVADDTPRSTTDAGGGQYYDGNVQNLGIPLAEGAEDVANPLTAAERAELAELRSKVIEKDISIKRHELWGNVQIAMLDQQNSAEEDGIDKTGSKSMYDLTLGGEYYFRDVNEWYSNFTLVAFVHRLTFSQPQLDGAQHDLTVFEYGGGFNWFFNGDHSKAETFMPYGLFRFSTGSITDEYSDTAGTLQYSASGSTSTMSFGGGVKYYSFRGYGIRFDVDYFTRTDSYGSVENFTGTATSSTSGFRFNVGLSYRFNW